MNAHTKGIWSGLVSFANAGTVEGAAKELHRTVTDYMPWFSQRDPFGLLSDEFFPVNWKAAAAEYQSPVQTLLRWLCSPKSDVDADTGTVIHPRDSLQAQGFAFLHEHAMHVGGIQFEEVPYVEEPKPNAPSEEVARHQESMKFWTSIGKIKDDSPLGAFAITRRYKDLADPICDFICAELQKFRDGEYEQPVPIFACPHCTKFVMPKRIGKKKFCSDCSNKARAEQYREKAPLDEAGDYQWLYRLERENPRVRGMKLKNPKNKKRIGDIKQRQLQHHSARCQRLIEKLKL